MSLVTTIINALTGNVLGTVERLFDSYLKKEISAEEFKSKTAIAVTEEVQKTERAWAEVAAKQYESFQQTARQSPVIARAYAAVIVTQLFILVWYQWGASAFLLITGKAWPSAGATVDWAYAILALCLGGGAFVFRGKGVEK